ncbi:hypothetical protein B0H19DRAFT_1128224 [Mycena capillaripes]|nr:hypothetical protein B0H19DRAFT_1128224 [Mycena capillaripes]
MRMLERIGKVEGFGVDVCACAGDGGGRRKRSRTKPNPNALSKHEHFHRPEGRAHRFSPARYPNVFRIILKSVYITYRRVLVA